MSKKSNDQGRAYEFACLTGLYDEIKKYRPVEIIKNSSYYAAEKAYKTLSDIEKETYIESSMACVNKIFELEPLILEFDNTSDDIIELQIQKDECGEVGDVRDILIERENIRWEIGLSVKHNHFAVKHSRLSKILDFGKKWYGIKCSDEYWNDVNPIFAYLEDERLKGSLWRELPDKEKDVYIPILKAFRDEIIRQNDLYGNEMPKLIVEYLLGKFDFYKVIGIDNKRTTRIQSYNLRGALNQEGRFSKSEISIPIAELPTRIVSLEFKPDSNNTLELYLDGGWQFSFRIHNASSRVETSLKFDIQIIGMPATIITINCEWNTI